MEEEKKLYPLKAMPLVSDDAKTSVQFADLGFIDTEFRNGWLAADTISEVMDMYMDRIVGESTFSYYGRQFPVMVKSLEADGMTPLMVHPDDVVALERYDLLGKAKLWYVAAAGDGACLYLGFKEDTPAADFYMACRHGEAENLLHRIPVAKGDSFFVAPGTVCCAHGPLKLIEIAQCSPLDFTLHTWGCLPQGDEFDEELNLDAAFDFINYGKDGHAPQAPAGDGLRTLVDASQFKVVEIKLSEGLHIGNDRSDCFALYTCVEGSACIRGTEDFSDVNFSAGETVLVPAELQEFDLMPRVAGTVLLETISATPEEGDMYINPDTEETLGDDEPETDGLLSATKHFS